MILRDMLNRIDSCTNVIICNTNGVVVVDTNNEVAESLKDIEVIFPISIRDNAIEIWIDKE